MRMSYKERPVWSVGKGHKHISRGGRGVSRMWTLVNYILEAVIFDAVISFILATIITIVYMAILDLEE